MKPHVVMTGPGGYLGGNLGACFSKAGWRVSGAGRRPQAGLEWDGRLDLIAGLIPEWPAADLLIHAAYDFTAATEDEIERRNVQPSIQILRTARESGISRVVFISSLAAHPDARSLYGRGKFRVEKVCRESGVTVIRPGLLYGAPQGGLTRSLARAVQALPVLPYPYYANAPMFACHVADVCRLCLAVGRLPQAELPTAPLIAAHDAALSFRELLSVIAAAQVRSNFLLPVPWRLPWCALRLAEIAGLRPGFRSDSLLSLASTVSRLDGPAPDLGIPFRPLTSATFSDPTPAHPAWSLPTQRDN